MKIVKPKVEYWEQGEDFYNHIAKCARVCYASDRTKNNQQFVNGLIHNNHLSMLRHWSVYFKIPNAFVGNTGKMFERYFHKIPYCTVVIDKDYTAYVSTNAQYSREVTENIMREFDIDIAEYEIPELEIKNIEGCKDIVRYTMFVQTSIDISRELNRVSPNNIAEQSTRYVEQGSICQSHFYEIPVDEVECDEFSDCCDKKGNEIIPLAKNNYDISDYLRYCYSSFLNYNTLLNCGFAKEDARKVLPLTTTTKCVYTYSLAEWKHILDLRLYGTTGKPHPDAKIIGELIQKQFYDIGVEV